MIQRVDKLWFGLLGHAHRWIECRLTAHYRREMVRQAEAYYRVEARRRLRRALATQKPHLN